MLYLRNRKNTEYREVEADSAEFYALTGERDPEDRRPIWEQVSAATVADYAERKEQGNLKAEDLGDGDQPVEDLTAAGAAKTDTFGPDFTEPTPGEVSQGAGRASDEDESDEEEESEEGAAPERPAADPEFLQKGLEESSGSSASATKADLEKQVEERDLGDQVVGTGSGGNVTKADLQKVLDDNPSDDGGGDEE